MKARVEYKGTSPLLMHNVRLANPLDPFAKQIKMISKKKAKTEDDYMDMARLEYEGSIYTDPDLGPYIPATNVDSSLVEGARVSRSGKTVRDSVFFLNDKIPVVYHGPRTVDELYADANFVDVRAVRVMSAKTMRTRPKFDNWSIKFDVELDTEIANPDAFVEWTNRAGARGLGDYRPRFGRFTSTVKFL